MGARPFTALTESGLSEALTARGGPGDQQQATQVHEQAMATIRELGLRGIERRTHHRSLRS